MWGLKTDTVNMKGWINEIVEYINSIGSNEEAIKALFVINQKIGYVKGQKDQYHYPTVLYDRLQITVNKLLEVRMKQGKVEPSFKTEKEIRDEMDAIRRTIENYRNAVKEGDFPKERMKFVLLENNSMLLALKWVLGENDRFD